MTRELDATYKVLSSWPGISKMLKKSLLIILIVDRRIKAPT